MTNLFTIGPVEMYKETLEIGGKQVPYFRNDEFSQIVLSASAGLKRLLNNNKGENVEEAGSEDFVHATDLTMLGADSAQLTMIDKALENIERGKYGICADCAEMISEARLLARPFARYCIKCKSVREARGEFNVGN